MTDTLLCDPPVTSSINTHNKPLLILAHGAGAPMDSDWMNRVSELFCRNGIGVVRFEFPYMHKRRISDKKPAPDRTPVLLDTWRNILNHDTITNHKGPLFIGGKSMGGRMATLIASGSNDTKLDTPQPIENPIAGCICFGYPFHPPRKKEGGKLDSLRTEHLGHGYTTPTLIVQGEKDTFGNREQVADYTLSPSIKMAWLDSANHDLKPTKASGFTHEDHLQSAVTSATEFIMEVASV